MCFALFFQQFIKKNLILYNKSMLAQNKAKNIYPVTGVKYPGSMEHRAPENNLSLGARRTILAWGAEGAKKIWACRRHVRENNLAQGAEGALREQLGRTEDTRGKQLFSGRRGCPWGKLPSGRVLKNIFVRQAKDSHFSMHFDKEL